MKSAQTFLIFAIAISAFLLTQLQKSSAKSSFLLESLGEMDDTDTSDTNDASDEITRRFYPWCKNVRSTTFCRRFAKFCSYSGKNGAYMRSNCQLRCGCFFRKS